MIKLLTPCGTFTGATFDDMFESIPDGKFGFGFWELRFKFEELATDFVLDLT